MRKLLVVLAGLVVVAAAGAIVLWPRQEPSRVTYENFKRIKNGMTHQEVEALLGGPPGDYTSSPVAEMVSGAQWRNSTPWVGDDGAIYVWFEEDRVWFMDFYDVVRTKQTPVDNLIWRLKRKWHRWFPE
jgi:hypothetical protein